MTRHRAGTGAPVTRGMRVLLVVAAVLVFLAGFQLTVFPTRTAEWFSWTIDVPMTAVFLGAAYWSSAVLEVAGARSRTWGRARLTVWTVLVFCIWHAIFVERSLDPGIQRNQSALLTKPVVGSMVS